MSPLLPNFDSIPDELCALPNWVCYRLETRPGETKPTKVPYAPQTGRKARADAPTTWGPIKIARGAYERSQKTDTPYAGVGYELADDDGFFGGDLDGCIDPETGEIAPWALDIIAEVDTYTEKSPSGTGLRFFGIGSLPPGGRKSGPVELYERLRFLTVTGHRFGDAPQSINDCSAVLPALHSRLFPVKLAPVSRPPADRSALSLTDQQLLDKASRATNGPKFDALWRGDTSGYASGSEADLALCSLLAFFCGNDAGRIDSLFRQSGLYRAKWDKRHHGDGRTYGQGTVDAALSGKSEFYTPGPARTTRAISRNSARPAGDGQDITTEPPALVWETPLPFTSYNLPAFPLEALPPALGEYVSEVALSVQVPPDMPALHGLLVVAAAGARRCRVQIGETHAEPLCLFGAVVMEPGSRKSAIGMMTAPSRSMRRPSRGTKPWRSPRRGRRAPWKTSECCTCVNWPRRRRTRANARDFSRNCRIWRPV